MMTPDEPRRRGRVDLAPIPSDMNLKPDLCSRCFGQTSRDLEPTDDRPFGARPFDHAQAPSAQIGPRLRRTELSAVVVAIDEALKNVCVVT